MKQDKTAASTLTKRRFVYWLSQNLTDGDGNVLCTKEGLLDTLRSKMPQNAFWALILHDRDPKDDDPQQLKAPHIHIFIRLKENNCTIERMSEILNIRSSQFVLPEAIRHSGYRVKGLDTDAHCVQYMTHEHADSKVRYADSLIETNDREHLDYLLAVDIVPPQQKEELARKLIEEITNNKTTLMQYFSADNPDFDGVLAVDKYAKLNNAEKIRILRHPQKARERRVIFISGFASDCGKTSLAVRLIEQIARRVYRAPDNVDCSQQQPFCFCMSAETSWNGYSSQPILLLDDILPSELKKTFGSASAVKLTLDPHPKAVTANVKGSHVNPCVEWVFITSTYDFERYMSELHSHVFPGEPVTQYVRRVSMRLHVGTSERFQMIITPEGYYKRYKQVDGIYCPIVAMQQQGVPVEWWDKALEQVVSELLTSPSAAENTDFIDFRKLGISLN